jgi:ADP-ribose pyrophosphatase YjhB (NUDIX family)
MRLYPGYWNGIGGFLDDSKTLEEKTREELKEELGISRQNIISLKPGKVFDLKEPKYQKVWLIYPVLAKVKNDKIKLDWEAEEYQWIKPQEAKSFKLAPGFRRVLKELFPSLKS